MGRDSHFNALLFNKLSLLIEQDNNVALISYLQGLSHSQYRTAGYILGERIGPSLAAPAFWRLFIALVQFDAKAFLVTLLKCFVNGIKNKTLSITDDGFSEASLLLKKSQIDAQKTINTVLPALSDAAQVRLLFTALGYEEMSSWIFFLLKSFNTVTAFVLLQALHYVEQDRVLLLKIARHLMDRGDSLSFNMVSLMKEIYALDELKGTFSLRIQPYKLSHIESSFDAFCRLVNMH